FLLIEKHERTVGKPIRVIIHVVAVEQKRPILRARDKVIPLALVLGLILDDTNHLLSSIARVQLNSGPTGFHAGFCRPTRSRPAPLPLESSGRHRHGATSRRAPAVDPGPGN